MRRRCDFLFGVVGGLHGQSHVRLAGTDPNLAHENVVKSDRVLAADFHLDRITGGQRGELDFPFPVLIGRGADSLFPIETVTFSPASAVPQTRTGRSRCSTIWFPKIRGKRTSAEHRDTAAVNDRLERKQRDPGHSMKTRHGESSWRVGGKWK